MSRSARILTAAIVLYLFALPASAQKKDLSLEDYAQWQRLGATVLSPDGSWFAYQIVPVEDDGWMVARPVDKEDEHRFDFASNPRFSADNRWLAFAIGLSSDEEKKLEKAKKPIRRSLGLMNLATTEVDTVDNVQSFGFSEDGAFLALSKYKDEDAKTAGSDLIIRNLSNGIHRYIGNVSDYAFSPEGALLAVAIDASEELGNSVQLHNLHTGTVRVLDSDETGYADLTWRRTGRDGEQPYDLAFLKEGDPVGNDYPGYAILAWRGLDEEGTSLRFDGPEHPDFPDGFRIAEEGGIRWSAGGQSLFFGLKERHPVEEPADDGAMAVAAPDTTSPDTTSSDSTDSGPKTIEERDADMDPPGVDIWHWKDARVQPQQEVRATSDKRYTFLSAWSPEQDSFVKLADENVRTVILTGDEKHAVGYDSTPYEPAFEESWNDIYVTDVLTGNQNRVLARIENVSMSPDGSYLLYFRTDDWYSYNIATGKHTNLTEDIPTRFNDFTAVYGREGDRAWGTGQWVRGDDWLLLYDQYDVYQVHADGSGARQLTHGAEDRIRFRQTRLDFDENALGPDEPIYFSAYGDFTKDSGYYVLRSNPGRTEDEANLDKLVYEPRAIGSLRKADDANVFTFTTQKADESPNVWVTDDSFRSPRPLTHTNPQQDDYFWAPTELITYRNARGEELQGRLLYPANYVEGRQYPMIVYIYELRSQSLHSYTTPSRTSAYNQRRFSSDGYFVFEPDITYRLRDPGISAVESIVPAVEEVLETGMVDRDRIGLTGHSWGAYQTAFVVTQTDLFAAAVAGAPLTNMISMYNSVYWNSGGTDAQIFEVSQGRFPDPYWEDWDAFVRNSPVFQAQNMNTPLMVAFGDDDGAVDFNQGVELYNTLRRMQKPFVMLVYEGENHGLAKKQNQIDYADRSHAWFNHFLLGQAAEPWITDGLPYLKKELEQKKDDEARKKAVTESK